MYELQRTGPRSFVINSPAKVGGYLADDGVYLIDSGSDKEAGRRVRKVLDDNGWRLLGILNTHSHADHIGGNHYLQSKTGCKVFASGVEAAFTRHPILEPAFLYGGSPCGELRHKFLLAQESVPVDFSDKDFPKEVEIIPLPGHSFEMVGFRTPDGVIFLADCLSSRETLEKYGLPFIYDVEVYLKTLDKVETLEAPLFVPAHAPTAEDVRELVRFNRERVLEAAERLTEICHEPLSFDIILQRTFEEYGLVMNFEQYALVGSTVRSYLSWLKGKGSLTAEFRDNLLLWRRA